ncbi:mercury(II) reductase [Thermococcus alcaliphilus]|uniref:mercury(II) reductase n=1 Tax=Thermococcus alcaliphilus TaxID=139207 RepID=UPI002090C4CD|nr:mercury(II) reductase [Thermococcus alcaliphilus]MCO6040691.1 mercury(II) reductase [Thermococcus alcaliphilus]
MNEYDFVIIGGGAAGFAAALKADELDVKTLMVNRGPIGGTCVNVGCVPTKYLLTALELKKRALVNHYSGLGFTLKEFDFRKLLDGKDELVKKLRREKYEKVLESLENVDYIDGSARFSSNSEIVVNGEKIKFKKALIATGAKPRILTIGGVEDVKDRILTHIEALELKKALDSVVIIGGRAQALEFAQIFARAGSEVTLLQRSIRIMPTAEPELAIELEDILGEEGVNINTSVKIRRLERAGEGVRVHAEVRGKEKVFEAQYVFFATGRSPNTHNLGLENTDVKTNEKGFVIVDETLKAGKNIYAAGDVIGEPMLETVAAKEGFTAATNALEEKNIKIDYRVVPKVVFTDPQLASVGLTDREAQKFTECSCRTVEISNVPKALILGEERGLIKMVVDAKTKEILGVHILAYNAAEMIHEAAMVIRNRMTVDEVIDTLHVFPTMSEAIKLAALSFKGDISKMPCCAL